MQIVDSNRHETYLRKGLLYVQTSCRTTTATALPPPFHAVRDLGSFSRTADTYRPQYLDDSRPSSHTGDGVSYQRRSTYYDRADEHQGSSISSTPPRLPTSLSKSQHRSPPPRPLIEMEVYRTSPRHFSVADSSHQSLSSVSHSRGSSLFQEAPDSKSESRSSSRSPRRSRSGISELDEESTLPQSSIRPVQEKALAHATNEMPLSGDDSNAPSEGSKCLGLVVHVPAVSADKQSSSHETIFANGNYAANQEALEPNASPLPIPKSVSSSDTTPHRGACANCHTEVATSHVEADSTILDSLRPSPEESSSSSSKVDRSAAGELSTSTERVTLDISTTSLVANACREPPPPSSTATLSPVAQIPEKESNVISSAIEPGSDIDHMNVIAAPEPAASSLRIVVSDHSTVPTSPTRRSVLRQPIDFKSTREGVQLVLVTRLRYDRQSRTERVFPVLRANQAISNLNLPPPPGNQNRRSEELIAANSSGRLATHEAVQSSLVDRFAERQSEIVEKSRRLKAEYLALHERWLEHCARLDEAQKNGIGIPEESAVPSSGRTTRRSTAVMGDAVRVEELTDPSYLALKNVAKIPDMISVTQGSVPYLFDDTNNIVDDPSEFYSASSGQDYWTEEERDTFLNEFAAHPKQFGLIAQRLPNKTSAQCVTYYYLHKKQGVDFRKAVMQYGTSRRRKNGRASKQRGNALLTDIRRHDDEVSRISPASLNEPAPSTGNKRKRAVDRSNINGESRRSSTSRRTTIQAELTSSGTTPDPDVEQPRRRRRTAVSTRAVTVVTANEVVNDNVVECPVMA
ncbi:hypothetical protein J3R83DRAFT_4992 [Lanmaoa asiatica]|nr:hypothetical protein J3R83DRAFT_4992 [Lanmaoa asiatica]